MYFCIHLFLVTYVKYLFLIFSPIILPTFQSVWYLLKQHLEKFNVLQSADYKGHIICCCHLATSSYSRSSRKQLEICTNNGFYFNRSFFSILIFEVFCCSSISFVQMTENNFWLKKIEISVSEAEKRTGRNAMNMQETYTAYLIETR